MLWILPIVAATALHAPAALQPPDASKLVKASLLTHDTQVKPGDTVQLAVVLDVAKDWHIYWPGQNDSGMPTTVELTFPAGSGLTAGPVSFPVPKRHIELGDILNYIHEGKVTVTIPVKVPAATPVDKSFKVTANVSYLVCKDSCMPGDAALTTTITTAAKTAPGSDAKAIDAAQATQPKPQTDGFDAAVTAKWEGGGDTLVLTAKEAAVTKVTFFPASDAAKLLDPIKTGEAKGNTLRLTFEHSMKAAEGVVALTSGNTTKAWTLNIPRPKPAGGEPATPETPKAPAEKPASDKPATPAR